MTLFQQTLHELVTDHVNF